MTTVFLRRSVLLVEDDPNDILLFRRAWARGKPQPNLSLVTDGEAAIAFLSGRAPWDDRDKHPLPSLVLLDLKLPRKSGFEVLVWIRAHSGLRRLPVIVFTSSRESQDVALAYELGANSYLVKPAGFEALLQTLGIIRNYWLGMNELPDADLLPAAAAQATETLG